MASCGLLALPGFQSARILTRSLIGAFTNDPEPFGPTHPSMRGSIHPQPVGPPISPGWSSGFQTRHGSADPSGFNSARPSGSRGEEAGGSARGASPFGSTDFFLNPVSSFPQLQSPRGLPGAQHRWSGTLPAQNVVLNQGQYGVSEAGHHNIERTWRQATTGWGRGDIASKDDPTHFRNAIRETGLMDSSREYDRNAIMGALLDDKPER